jgi:PAS domain S-box-containing protein
VTDLRIFIVEDEGIVADDIAQSVQSLGYRVAGTARSGETAIDRILESRPDIILMDIRLAGDLDGVQVAGELKKTVDIPVIYLTAYADRELLDRAKLTEPYGYLVKPYDERELQTSIEIAWYRNSMHKKLAESEARYRGFVETLPGIAFRFNPDFSPVFFHGAVEKITGYPEAELITGNPSWQSLVYPDDLQAFARQNEELLRDPPDVCEREYRIRRKDGKIAWVHELTRYHPGTGGGSSFIQGTIYDISGRKAAEEALIAYIREIALRIRQPVEIIRDNLLEIVGLIHDGKVTPEEISLVLMGQVRNATQIAANVEEFQKAIDEKNGLIPASLQKIPYEVESHDRESD